MRLGHRFDVGEVVVDQNESPRVQLQTTLRGLYGQRVRIDTQKPAVRRGEPQYPLGVPSSAGRGIDVFSARLNVQVIQRLLKENRNMIDWHSANRVLDEIGQALGYGGALIINRRLDL